MKVHPFDRLLFYFEDMRFMYSVNQIKMLVIDEVADPDSIIRISEQLAFRAGDIALHAAPLLYYFLALALDEPAESL
jgi:hypothetical protein